MNTIIELFEENSRRKSKEVSTKLNLIIKALLLRIESEEFRVCNFWERAEFKYSSSRINLFANATLLKSLNDENVR